MSEAAQPGLKRRIQPIGRLRRQQLAERRSDCLRPRNRCAANNDHGEQACNFQQAHGGTQSFYQRADYSLNSPSARAEKPQRDK